MGNSGSTRYAGSGTSPAGTAADPRRPATGSPAQQQGIPAQGSRVYPGAGAQVGGLVLSQNANQEGGPRLPLGHVQNYFEGMRPDLAYLNLTRPSAANPPMQRTRTIRNDVNLKKTTLKLVPDASNSAHYHIEFVLDATLDCNVSIHYMAQELPPPSGGGISFSPLVEGSSHPKQFVAKGLGQPFRTRSDKPLDLSLFRPEHLTYDSSHGRYPIVICLEVAPGAGPTSKVSSQTTFANLVKSAEGDGHTLRLLKQKIQVEGHSYELQEIYGIEGQGQARAAGAGTPADDSGEGPECVICMSSVRDTTVLPCRHMCMCAECAKVLRLQSNKCPICRTAIQSLLQIKFSNDSAQGGTSAGAGSSAAAGAPPQPLEPTAAASAGAGAAVSR